MTDIADNAAFAAKAEPLIALLAFLIAFDRDLSKIPGPFLSRFTTLPLKYHVLAGRRTHYIHALHKQYGPYVRIAPREVATADIKAFREVHRIGTRFTKAPWYQNQDPSQYSDDTCGVFGVLRKAQARRKLFQQAGTKAAVRQWEPMVVDAVQRTIVRIKKEAANGKADVMKWRSLMVADILGTLAFGDSFRLIETGEKTQLIKDIETSMQLIGLKLELPWLFSLIWNIPLPAIGTPRGFFKRFGRYGDVAVQNTKRAPKGSVKTLFSKMVPEEGEQPFPDSLIAKESANIIVAGVDTTAMTLTYLVYAVLANPEIK